MGDVAVSAVINKTIEMAETLIMEESSRLYRLREDILWLEQQMRLMQAYLQVAEDKKVTNPMVETFIKGIRDLAHDVEDIFDIFLPQIEEHKSNVLLKRVTHIVPYSVTCSKLSREIEKIRKRVEGIKEDNKIYDIPDINLGEGADESNVDPRTTKLGFDDSMIVGFDQDIGEVKTKLEEHQFVTIVGMPGLGKTTLAKKVFKHIKDEFDCSASVSVSQDPNIEALLKDISTQVGLEEKKRDENLEVNLKSLLQDKRYLLLLDDVWSTQVWDRLRECFPFYSDQSASRIIITSRNTGVGRYIGCEDSLHFLHPFDEPTSWELFSKSIIPFFKSAEEFEHSGLKKIGEEIVKKCGGVPLAIVVTVGMLREREKSEFCWNDVLNSIGHDASDKCFQIFSLSYIDLPTVLKSCFLYFGNFPEDYEFSAFELIRMWVAEKLVLSIQGRDPEDVGKSYMSKLDSRNLIQVVEREHDGRVKKFRVHDLLYSLCVEKGREFDFLNTVDCLEPTVATKVRRLGVFGDAVLNYPMPKIRGLFHFKFDKKIQEKHLKRVLGMLRLLRVLKFENTFDGFCLPTSVESLSCLNYLQISRGYDVEIPLSIQNLKNLETLIVECWRLKIPIRIWKMEQLKHLHLDVVVLSYHKCDYYLRLVRGLQVQVSLPNIQTLYLPRGIQSRLKDSHVLPNLTTLRKLSLGLVRGDMMEVLCGREPISNNLETLHCFEFYNCSGMRMNLSKYDMLINLKIGYFSDLDLQDHDLPPSLMKVTLWKSRISNSTMETLKKLPKLKILRLMTSDLGRKMDCSGGFLQLQVLKLVELPNLMELIEGEEMGMPELRQLIIKDCPKLMIIPGRLQQLRIQTN